VLAVPARSVRSSDDDDDLTDRRASVGHELLLGGATRKRARKSNHGVALTAATPPPRPPDRTDPDDGSRPGTHTPLGSRLVRELQADAQRWAATTTPAEVLSQIAARSRPTHNRSSARSSIMRRELRGSI
jgi:hypothetical protein